VGNFGLLVNIVSGQKVWANPEFRVQTYPKPVTGNLRFSVTLSCPTPGSRFPVPCSWFPSNSRLPVPGSHPTPGSRLPALFLNSRFRVPESFRLPFCVSTIDSWFRSYYVKRPRLARSARRACCFVRTSASLSAGRGSGKQVRTGKSVVRSL
jgi:hypothetical protein